MVACLLRPRLTSALRALAGAEPEDVDRLFVDRAAELRAAAERAPAAAAALTWKSFVAAHLGSASRELRGTFNEFMALMQAAAGSETPAGEAALFAFVSLGARWAAGEAAVRFPDPAEEAEAKAELQAGVGGRVGHEDWHRLLVVVAQLRVWQVEHDIPLPADPGALVGSAAAEEFGAAQAFEDMPPPPPPSSLSAGALVDEWLPVALAQDMLAQSSAAEPGGEEELAVMAGPEWLLDMCEQHVSHFAPHELAANIVETIGRCADSDERLQSELFELLGGDSFDFIAALFAGKERLARLTRSDMKSLAKRRARGGQRSGASGPQPQQQQRGGGFTVRTQSDINADKARRKEARRQGGGGGGEDPLEALGFSPAMLQQERLLGLQGGDLRREPEPIHLSDVLEYRGDRKTLPPGTTRMWFDDNGYEEVMIPPQRPPAGRAAPRLIKIAELEPFAQLAFRGTEKLNRLQSEIFETAYTTSENLLVCAPTGAGKTNVAMLTVLQQVAAHMEQGVLLKDKLKIIYVAPMKALAQEVVGKFGQRLRPLGMKVAELTGDMQMTKREIEDTQVIVTTPEKWDVITRKSGDGTLVQQVRLLIIDEVHLLADERGNVIESIVARTLRMVETSQSMVRIVGLSATLPSYKDVARFLRVGERGLFYFDDSYRPVALRQTFIGINGKGRARQMQMQARLAYEKSRAALLREKQVMIFVHSRKETVNTCKTVWSLASRASDGGTYTERDPSVVARYSSQVAKSKNADLRELFEYGMGIHHAGMLRPDRTLVERMFMDGAIKTLCCTATLAWGINLPAHTVIIKGADVYKPEKGGMQDLGMLDVMQIFGRAGRPQFDTEGDAIMLMTHEQLPRYLGFLSNAMPIESSFIKALPDHLNAEVVSGTVTSVAEAVTWLSYTYLHVRMCHNPMVYGLTLEDLENDPQLHEHRTMLIETAARTLDECRMLRFDARSGNLGCTDMGRVASHYYIRHQTVEEFQEHLEPHLTEAQIFGIISSATEFENVKVRDEELKEMDELAKSACQLELIGSLETNAGKVNLLLQAYLSYARPRAFTLISDTNYVVQNAGRIARALFETALKKGWSSLTERMLTISKAIDKRQWWFQTPLRQFPHANNEIMHKVESARLSIDRILDMDAGDVGRMVRNVRSGEKIKGMARQMPRLEVEASVQTITRGIIRVTVTLSADFDWHDRMSGTVEPFWIWIEDGENEHIYHHEYFLLHKHLRRDSHELEFTIPIFEPLPPQYFVKCVSDRWLGAETVLAVSFQHLILPQRHPPHTPLLDLQPLPVTALGNPEFEALYPFSHFNPLQTQIFHTAYHTNKNMLLGSPTGSGKTIAAELAVLRLFNATPGAKTVYVAPLKALARERIKDWGQKFGRLGKRVVELTGDVSPDMAALKAADILVTTPEKWDGITRGWRSRGYVKSVQLVVIDEIHLLGEDRGPILEVIVSRMRYISEQTRYPVRIVGLSTALANAQDLADWLGIKKVGLYNFSPAVRPIPMEVHIQGFPGKHYCPRMATMNKPTHAAIMEHSPNKPVLVFVASRRQTRLTALDLISYCAAGENPRQFLNLPEEDLDQLVPGIKDSALKHTIAFGIGIHHAGLCDSDRTTVEELFVSGRIQVLVCTSTLAWGVNFPAHLVVVKGTEYFDGKTHRYVDFPITDVLQMIGRAGRPQFDDHGVACILVHEPKKNFYRKFLYEPFPVESQLRSVLHNHLNAEIAAGSIKSRADAADWLSWTYFFRRLVQNPSYYDLEGTTAEDVHDYLLSLVETTLRDLELSGCVVMEDEYLVEPDTLGLITSYYYLEYTTGRVMRTGLRPSCDMEAVVRLLSNAHEYRELPVRHNEDRLNAQLAAALPWRVEEYLLDSPHAKCFLLLQARLLRVPLPIADYNNDTKSVVDQALRITNAMVDVAGDSGFLETTLNVMRMSQLIVQARFPGTNSLMQLPHLRDEHTTALGGSLAALLDQRDPSGSIHRQLRGKLSEPQITDVKRALGKFPRSSLSVWSAQDGEAETVEPDSEQTIRVRIEHSRRPGPVHAPKFHKPKKHGWWLVLGLGGELLALKRVSGGERVVSLDYDAPEEPGTYQLTLHLISDCVYGLDVEREVELVVSP